MQVIYAIPFVLVSLFAFVVCTVVRPWRRYKFQALVAPLAFGFCSIVACGAFVLACDHFNLVLIDSSTIGMLLIYVLPGLIGSWAAVLGVARITRRDIQR